MKKYIDEACRLLPTTLHWAGASRIKYQNRIIDKATALYVSDPVNFSKLFSWYRPRIAEDQAVEDHHGVAIGCQIGWVTSGVDSGYFKKVARVKRDIKALVRQTTHNKQEADQ